MRSTAIVLALLAGCTDPTPGSAMVPCDMNFFKGACVYAPTVAATRTGCGEVSDFCDASGDPAPNLSCLSTATAPATSGMVTVTGFVHALTTGPDTNGLSVAFYQAAPLIAGQDIGVATPIAQAASVPLKPETQRACNANPPFGCSLPATCEVPCADGLDGRPDLSKYCLAGADGSTSCVDRLRWEARYTVANVPTNKQLVVRVAATNGQSDQNWVQLVTWNVYLPSNARACVGPDDNNCRSANGTYQLDVSALSRSAYWNIPRAAGLSGGITTGMGAILGEVRDCNDVRVQNVAVTTTALADRLAYFKSTPTGPQPDAALLATAQPGLYTALNLKPGRTTVITAGLVNDTLTSFGSFDAFVYANTVSLVNINAGNPRP